MGAKDIWEQRGEWEIRVLVLFSLALQIFLLFAGGLRKRRSDWWLRLLLWLAYLLADYIAIYTLGHLSQKQKLPDGSNDGELQLLVFWAPFLILHLGGQDTVTAFAVEDNELWLRHFLSLLSQVFLAGYVYRKSHPGIRLMRPAIIMFVAGVIKYGERTLALRAASMGSLRSSMLTPPDPGPNYAKFVEEYQSRKNAGLDTEIVIVPERPPDGDDEHQVKDYSDLVYNGHRFYQIFRRLLVDLILSFQDRIDSLAVFEKLDTERAFKLVEVELVLMYESLHTKALVIQNWVGRGLRLCTLAAPVVSLVLFTGAAADMDMTPAYKHKRVDIVISYVLLSGAIFLELYAIVLTIVSPWTYADLRAISSLRLRWAADAVFLLINRLYPEKGQRWSNEMSQYNLIGYCLKDKPRWYKKPMEMLEWKLNFGVKTLWDSWRYTDEIVVSEQLKGLIFEQIKTKASSTKDPGSYRKLGEHRGQWALQRKGLYHDLGWSVDCEFDESILLWHIATDLCFHHQYAAETRDDQDDKCCGCTKCFCSCFGSDDGDDSMRDRSYVTLATMSRMISNYMLFLLVMRPFMMTASIGQIRFHDTCAEAKSFFRRDDDVKDYRDYLLLLVKLPCTIATAIFSCVMCGAAANDERQVSRAKDEAAAASAKELMEVDTEIAKPRQVKGDRSKSVLFQACDLARQLRGLQEDRRWSLIVSVWVEMLCYAAGKCRGNSHARQLSQGGELLTVVWLLMAHFGVGDQYQVESGHARAKIIVYNK